MINKEHGKGHNSGDAIGGIASAGLRQLVARIETLEEEKRGLQADIKAVSAQAGMQGFDLKILRKRVQRRRIDAMVREKQDQILAVYEEVLA
ncbi:DUF2312 domain-containing protein [Haematospirillum jordaniae]|uniref:DUF2312 domain-containing protein n=1 Tax=Haematospirillum jordaniae TaxID=1549855 RepID=UPI0014331770|nr:GapR family DNA-binding domain-containing protein [Haematospirillum jordaniae]NKD45365.1 DUF2312 domain-containing protein [Haematospirillum jordaniae]